MELGTGAKASLQGINTRLSERPESDSKKLETFQDPPNEYEDFVQVSPSVHGIDAYVEATCHGRYQSQSDYIGQ